MPARDSAGPRPNPLPQDPGLPSKGSASMPGSSTRPGQAHLAPPGARRQRHVQQHAGIPQLDGPLRGGASKRRGARHDAHARAAGLQGRDRGGLIVLVPSHKKPGQGRSRGLVEGAQLSAPPGIEVVCGAQRRGVLWGQGLADRAAQGPHGDRPDWGAGGVCCTPPHRGLQSLSFLGRLILRCPRGGCV
jgi:hypothetical protein